MTLRAPASLAAAHRLEGFDCGKPALNDRLLRHARQAQGSGLAKTFVVADDDRVAGHFSLTVGQVDTLDAPPRIRQGMGQHPVPVVILARLAVSQQDQGRGTVLHPLRLHPVAAARAAVAAAVEGCAALAALKLGKLCRGSSRSLDVYVNVNQSPSRLTSPILPSALAGHNRAHEHRPV